MAGATVVQVGTGSFMKPDLALDVIDGLEAWLEERGIENINEIRGSV